MREQPSELIAKLICFIEMHLDRTITLNELAELSELSRFHLTRRFKAETGETPMQFHLRKRIEKAKELLAGGLTAVHVAKKLGFSDGAHFSRQFKKVTGKTPGTTWLDLNEGSSD